tara:strand:- start:727 stop:1536 length:810 start_codon:yes stop_codon:yes gene_type:complete
MNYHQLDPFTDGINWSFLMKALPKLGGSWKQAYHDMILTKTVPNDAMRFGTLVHGLILEPELFDEQFVIAPPGLSKRTKAYKAMVEMNATKTVVTQEDMERATLMRHALRLHSGANTVLWGSNAVCEEVIQGTMQIDNEAIPVRAKLDLQYWLGEDLVVADLKTTKSIAWPDFKRSILNYGYLGQIAFYMDIVGAQHAQLVVVQSVPPHQVMIVNFSAEALDLGRGIYTELLRQYIPLRKAELEDPGIQNWPGCDNERTFRLEDVPAWW